MDKELDAEAKEDGEKKGSKTSHDSCPNAMIFAT